MAETSCIYYDSSLAGHVNAQDLYFINAAEQKSKYGW